MHKASMRRLEDGSHRWLPAVNQSIVRTKLLQELHHRTQSTGIVRFPST